VELETGETGKERLDPDSRVQPSEYPAQFPPFQEAKDIILDIFLYQTSKQCKVFWENPKTDDFIKARISGPGGKFAVYIKYICYACGSTYHNFQDCPTLKKTKIRFCRKCGCPGVGNLERCLFKTLHDKNLNTQART